MPALTPTNFAVNSGSFSISRVNSPVPSGRPDAPSDLSLEPVASIRTFETDDHPPTETNGSIDPADSTNQPEATQSAPNWPSSSLATDPGIGPISTNVGDSNKQQQSKGAWKEIDGWLVHTLVEDDDLQVASEVQTEELTGTPEEVIKELRARLEKRGHSIDYEPARKALLGTLIAVSTVFVVVTIGAGLVLVYKLMDPHLRWRMKTKIEDIGEILRDRLRRLRVRPATARDVPLQERQADNSITGPTPV